MSGFKVSNSLQRELKTQAGTVSAGLPGPHSFRRNRAGNPLHGLHRPPQVAEYGPDDDEYGARYTEQIQVLRLQQTG